MDYRELLKKYAHAVSVAEGDDFALNPGGGGLLTPEELAEVSRLLAEADNNWLTPRSA